MRVPLIISPSGQPLAKAQYPCKPPRMGKLRRQNPEVRTLLIVRVPCVRFYCIFRKYINIIKIILKQKLYKPYIYIKVLLIRYRLIIFTTIG